MGHPRDESHGSLVTDDPLSHSITVKKRGGWVSDQYDPLNFGYFCSGSVYSLDMQALC